MADTLEQQIRDKFESAYLFAFEDAPEPQTGTVLDPMAVQVYQSRLQQEMRKSILLLARELDELKHAA